MALRTRRRRTGPGPTTTALALFALVVAVAYVYYETPLLRATSTGADGLPGPPRPAWSAELPAGWADTEPGELLLSVGERHILAVRRTSVAVDAVWYDRFGYLAAQSAPVPAAGDDGAVLAASGLLAAAGPTVNAASAPAPTGDPITWVLRVVAPTRLPVGSGWSPPAPTASIVPAAVHGGLLAAAVFGAPDGPDLTPDLLVVLDIGGPEPVLRWSQPYDDRRLLQLVAGPAALAAAVVDPVQGTFQVELWSWQGERLWSSDPSVDFPRPLAVGPSVQGDPDPDPPRAYVAAGSSFTALGPGGGGRVLEGSEPPRRCWAVGSGVACFRPSDPGRGAGEDPAGDGADAAGDTGGQLLFLTAGGRVSRHGLVHGAAVWPWPGRGALVAAGDSLTAFDAAGARWTVDLPVAPGALAVGDGGIAVSDGRRLAWLHWPAEGGR